MKFRLLLLAILMSLLFLLVGCNLSQQRSEDNIVFKTVTPSSNDTLKDIVQNSSPPISNPVLEHVRQIITVGQSRNNRLNVFSKVGDSISVSRGFMYPVGDSSHDLGKHNYLQAVINFYQAENARTGNSFVNSSLAAGEGWAAWGVLNPQLADTRVCAAGESPLVCEYRVVRPAVAVIMFGTNDVGYRTGDQFRADMNQVVNISVEMGVVPILTTIPNRPDVANRVVTFNDIVRDIAQEQQLPLIDYYEFTKNLPNSGLTGDNVHPSIPPAGYLEAGRFSDNNLRYGYTVRNLATLQALYSILIFLNAS